MLSSRAVFYYLYRSAYFLLYIILLAFLLITPADAIIRSFDNDQQYNIIIIAVVYVTTSLIVVFVYALRLFLNKSVLASIPKSWVPIEKTDVKKRVYEMISVGLSRSAAIALWSRPRILERREDGSIIGYEKEYPPQQQRNTVEGDKTLRTSDDLSQLRYAVRPVWGEIDHPGWASPNSPDLPNLQYGTVLSELPNLIEAKALTLAPSDPTLSSSSMDAPMLDMESIGLLQRPPHTSLRRYVEHLVELGVLEMNTTTKDFLTLYEYARFSNRPVSNAYFREIMRNFADILRSLGSFDSGSFTGREKDEEDEEGEVEDAYVGEYETEQSHLSEFEEAGEPSSRLGSSTPRSRLTRTPSADSSSLGSVRRGTGPSSSNAWHRYRTAPNTPRSRMTARLSQRSSNRSLARSTRPYPMSKPSSASLRSKMSTTSTSSASASGSVIRLATAEDRLDLPYVLTMRETGAM